MAYRKKLISNNESQTQQRELLQWINNPCLWGKSGACNGGAALVAAFLLPTVVLLVHFFPAPIASLTGAGLAWKLVKVLKSRM